MLPSSDISQLGIGLDARSDADVKITNVVATADLRQHLDLNMISQLTPGAKYNPQQFPALIYKLQRPRTTTLLFTSGKMVCTGAKSSRLAKRAVAQLINKLTSNGIVIIARPDPEVQNIVATVDLHGIIDLESVAERLSHTLYEPEQFPGLIYRMKEPKVVFLVFASGRLVCTGAKVESEVHSAVQKLLDILQLNGLIAHHEPSQGKGRTDVAETVVRSEPIACS